MVIWLFSYMADIGDMMNSTTNEYEQSGTAIGGTLGIGMLVIFWALMDVILGLFVLFTRPKAA
ncbi:hypothetical protein GCM10027040_23670 [Halomonas shantousis]